MMQRNLPLGNFLLILLATFFVRLEPLQAATFTVDTTVDTVDVIPGDGSALDAGGATSLRAAIMEANALAGDDVVILPKGIFTLSLVGTLEDAAATGDLDLTANITIQGDGDGRTIIHGAGLDRVFHVINSASAEFEDVIITGGSVTGGNGGGIYNAGGSVSLLQVTVGENQADNGGGIANDDGDLTLTDSFLFGNSAQILHGGGIYSSGGFLGVTGSVLAGNFAQQNGGGIFNELGPMDISMSSLLGNVAFMNGGGVYTTNNSESSVLIEDSEIAGNFSSATGGGIYVENDFVEVQNSIVSGNESTHGGGIENRGNLSISNSEILRNLAIDRGGAIENRDGLLNVSSSNISHNFAELDGGAIENTTGGPAVMSEITITDSTFADNYADGSGGAINNKFGIVFIIGSSFQENFAGLNGGAINNSAELGAADLDIDRSSFSGNGAGDSGGVIYNRAGFDDFGSGTPEDRGFALITNSTLFGNTAGLSGGGIFNDLTGDLTVEHSTIVGNNAVDEDGIPGLGGGIANLKDTAALSHNVITDNFEGPPDDPFLNDLASIQTLNEVGVTVAEGIFDSGSTYNLVGVDTGFTGFSDGNGNNNQIGILAAPLDPGLSPPVFNQAGTIGLVPLPGGLAFNGGDPTFTSSDSDQAGGPRVVNSIVDIGAIETQALIGDFVWFDADGDGLQDPDEEGVPGISIQIDLGEGSIIETVSDENGFYLFNLSADTYTLQFFIRDGLAFTTPNASNNDTNSDVVLTGNPLIGETSPITVALGDFRDDIDGGIIRSGFASPSDPFLVTTFDDNGNREDDDISLREAVDLSNIIPGPNTILLPVSSDYELPLGALFVAPGRGALTIEPDDEGDAVLVGSGEDRLLVNAGEETTLNGLILMGGRGVLLDDGGALANIGGGYLILNNCFLEDNTSPQSGGAIVNNSGNLEINDSTFINNSAEDSGGAIANFDQLHVSHSFFDANFSDGGSGGAVYNDLGTATFEYTDFVGNFSDIADGGAVFGFESDLTFTDCDFIQNNVFEGSPGGHGGAVYIEAGNLHITLSLFEKNFSQNNQGGAVYAENSTTTLEDCNLINNYANNEGGAIYAFQGNLELFRSTVSFNNSHSEEGGGIFTDQSTVILDDCVLDGNITNHEGGAIFSQNGSLTILHSHLSDNVSFDYDGGGINSINQPLRVENSTFDNNFSDDDGGAIYHSNGSLVVIDSSFTGNNSSDDGGAIFHFIGPMMVQNSDFTGNISFWDDGGAIGSLNGEVEIIDSFFTANQAYDEGGAVDNFNGSLIIQNTTFSDNYTTEDEGGAINHSTGEFHFTLCTFTNNNTTDWGGAVYTFGSNGFIEDCFFSENSSLDWNGGALYIFEGTVTLETCVFENNFAEDQGGAIYFRVNLGNPNQHSLTLENCSFSGNSSLQNEGGAIYNSEGILDIWDSEFLNNFAFYDGGAIYTSKGEVNIVGSGLRDNRTVHDGGAIATGGGAPSALSNIFIVDSYFTGNLADSDAGAIYNDGNMFVADTLFELNTAFEDGGAIHNGGTGDVQFENSFFLSNKATGWGGAVSESGSGQLTFTDCLFEHNAVNGEGGVLNNHGLNTVLFANSTLASNSALDDGGAIWMNQGSVTLLNSTLSGNTATTGEGGAIFISDNSGSNSASVALIEHSTIVDNNSDGLGGGIFSGGSAFAPPLPLEINHSIIAGNFSNSSDEDDLGARNTIVMAFYNLIGNPTGHILFGVGADTNLVGTNTNPLDPLLGPLDDNGGFTPTHVPLFGSPAVDAGDATISIFPLNDQRGFNRLTGVIDIGSVEAPTTADIDGPYSVDEDLSLTLNGSGTPRESSGVLSFAWDLDNDGQYDDATGTSPVFTWDNLTGTGGFNLTDGDHIIGLQVTDVGTVTIIATQTTTLTINFFDLEVWRRRFFTMAELADTKSEDPIWGNFANPDNDRFSNLLEFFMALNPLVKDDDGLLEVNASDTELTFRYRRAKNTGNYVGFVEWSTDLINWSNTGVTEQVLVGPLVAEDYNMIQATIPLSGETEMFVRLIVSLD